MQAKAEYAGYYKNSLLYLACINVEQDLSRDEQIGRAHDLGLSALLGPTIYNFGELVGYTLATKMQYFRLTSILIVDAPYTRFTGRNGI